jgi:hypothetical protein
MPRRNSPRSENLRRALAQEAARVMAEHGIQDFRAAKRKAADRLGVGVEGALPSNTEVEAALVEYQRLFAADSHGAAAARAVERRLRAAFAVCLLPAPGGPVLNGRGCAHRRSCICSPTSPEPSRSTCWIAASARASTPAA